MKALKAIALVALVAAAFGGGYVARTMKAGGGTTPTKRILYYIDPMHPAYTSDKPGIAPDCGMALEPVYADEPAPAGTAGGHQGPETARPAGPALSALPPGTFAIPLERQQLIGVRFATVEWNTFARAIRTVGKVSFDETRLAHVHSRVEGWIEQVLVDFTGDFVKKGEPMVTIYSPEMLASQEELLLAARARDLMATSPLGDAATHGASLFEAARQRLELWDLSADQIQHVLETGRPIRHIALHAPITGIVLERNAFPNQKVTPDSDLYTIADLSRVWIMADVFESDIAAIKLGAPAYLMFPGSGAPPTGAKVDYIQPQVDPMTRTLKVRLNAANPGLRLKPEMFVDVEFGIPAPKRLTVPAEAVLDTGDRQTVFVDLGNGYLEPRRVEIGEHLGDRLVVTNGVSAGERVVASGTFLVDSESQLRAAATATGKPEHRHD